MERLNEIMMRSTPRRPQNQEQRPSRHLQQGPRSQQPLRPVPSEPTEHGQRPGESRSHPHYRPPQAPPHSRMGQNTGYPRRDRYQPPESFAPQHFDDIIVEEEQPVTYARPVQSIREPRTPYTDTYYDAYPPMPADVQEEWEDDAEGMRYGDWESDEGNLPAYGQTRVEMIPSAHYPPVTRDIPALPQQSSEGRRFVTRKLNDRAIPATQPPMPPSMPQELHYQPRTTQPLTPQKISGITQDTPERLRTQQPGRQLTVRSPGSVYTPTPSSGACALCKGAGYVRANVPFGHPNFGKAIACECKEAEKKVKRRLQLEEMSNLGAFRNKNFKNFNANVSPVIQRAFQEAYRYAQDPDGWLVLVGRNGCGKTHLAAAIANQYLASGSLVLFTTVPELLDHLRATFAPNSPTVYDQQFSSMREAELLVLDDLGAQQSSPWANEKLFQLLNYRYNSRFPTIITMNNSALQNLDERIRSRLTDASLVTTVTFDGAQDYRPRNPRRE